VIANGSKRERETEKIGKEREQIKNVQKSHYVQW
jgi:hypothetical protein